jgi:hypothetical protein
MDQATIALCFGALAPSLRSQFSELGVKATPQQLTRWQAQADAIVRLFFGKLLTEAEVHKCRKRLMKQITEDLAEIAARQPAAANADD